MLKRITYEDMLLELLEFELWLGHKGIKTTLTRLEEVINFIEILVGNWKAVTLEQLISRVSVEYLYYGLSEANAFIYAYNSLKLLPDNKIPRKLLRQIILGPFLAKDEISGDANVNPRNFLFEIEIAAKLVSKGLKITGVEDVQFDFEHYNFAIQCMDRLH